MNENVGEIPCFFWGFCSNLTKTIGTEALTFETLCVRVQPCSLATLPCFPEACLFHVVERRESVEWIREARKLIEVEPVPCVLEVLRFVDMHDLLVCHVAS